MAGIAVLGGAIGLWWTSRNWSVDAPVSTLADDVSVDDADESTVDEPA